MSSSAVPAEPREEEETSDKEESVVSVINLLHNIRQLSQKRLYEVSDLFSSPYKRNLARKNAGSVGKVHQCLCKGAFYTKF